MSPAILLGLANYPDFYLQLWLQLAQFDLGAGSSGEAANAMIIRFFWTPADFGERRQVGLAVGGDRLRPATGLMGPQRTDRSRNWSALT